VDTANPDSGDVEAPDGPSQGWIKVRVSPRSGPGSKRKNRARSTCPAPVLAAEHLLLGWVRTTSQWQSIGVLRWNLSTTARRSAFFRCPLSRCDRIKCCI